MGNRRRQAGAAATNKKATSLTREQARAIRQDEKARVRSWVIAGGLLRLSAGQS